MYSKKLTYVDFNGNEVTSTLHFNFTKSELMTFVGKYAPGAHDLKSATEVISENNDLQEMVPFIIDLITSAYGERSADGVKFIKNEQVKQDFTNSAAFEAYFDLLLGEDTSEIQKLAQGLHTSQADRKKLVEEPRA